MVIIATIVVVSKYMAKTVAQNLIMELLCIRVQDQAIRLIITVIFRPMINAVPAQAQSIPGGGHMTPMGMELRVTVKVGLQRVRMA